MLELFDVCAGYGDLTIVDGISMKVGDARFVGVVGANAAGKTTLARAIAGVIPVTRGEIWWEGRRLDKMPLHERPRVGIAMVPEGRGLFDYMTVRDNLELGTTARGSKGQLAPSLERIYGIFPVLKERERVLARSLSGGQQQMLAIARALMGEPKLLVLDEPSIGLAPNIVAELFALLKKIAGEGISILLIEQDVRRCLSSVADAYVIANGRIVIEGAGCELIHEERIRAAYLGL